VEPLEASSIGSTIQQVKQIVPYLASYQPGHTASQKHFNASMKLMMRNILTMVRLHYYSDRQDTPFWREMSVTPLNEELQEMIELWAERPPTRFDFSALNGEMFLSAHLWHVAQGQNAINPDAATTALNRLGIRQSVEKKIAEYKANRNSGEQVDHATALREIVLIDKEWNQ
jgi:tryptophan halogenase